MRRYSNGIVAAILVIMACVLGAAMGSVIDMRDPAMPDPPTTSTSTTMPVADQPLLLPVPLSTEAATATAQASRAPAIQMTEPPALVAVGPPAATPGDCGSWQEIFRYFGATDEEIYFFFVETFWGRDNVIWGESMCGTRFRNPDTSDTGICQLNGVHRDWVKSEFGLRIGSGVSEAEASNPYYAAACLYLLRGLSHEPNAFGLACAWRAGRFCS